jgi:hypothetical protein
MKSKVNAWIDQFPDFNALPDTAKVVRLVFFHTVEENRETISRPELEQLFQFAGVRTPDFLRQVLTNLSRKGGPLIKKTGGEFSLERGARKSIQGELDTLAGKPKPPKVDPVPHFEFPGKVFTDKKVEVLLLEVSKCYATECWNACGILMRIILERTLDSVDPRLKAAVGLKDKLNIGISTAGLFSKTLVDTLKELKAAKLIGDIVAHHSTVVLDKPDINFVVPSLRMLLKEVKTI